MKLSEMIAQGKIMHSKAKLLIDLNLDDGEKRKIGDVVDILINYGDGKYHAEDNGFACKVDKSEIEFI